MLTNIINRLKGVPTFIEKRPFVSVFIVLGSLFGIAMLGYAIESEIHDDGFVSHVWLRSLLHLGWGGILARTAFFGLTQLDNNIKYNFDFRQYYGIPVAVVLIIALNQEFGWPGDFRHNIEAGQIKEALKSFVDIITWSISAVYSMWTTYRNSENAYKAKLDYLNRRKRETIDQ